VNPQAQSQYLPNLGFDEWYADAPQILEGFYNTCAMAGPGCPIGTQNSTPESVKNTLNQLLQKIFDEMNNGTGIETYNAFVFSDLYQYLNSPQTWTAAAGEIATRISGNLTSASSSRHSMHSEYNRLLAGFGGVGGYVLIYSTSRTLIYRS
jgi:hypothetical protein